MKLPKPPNYKKDARITPRGWRHPRTNELLMTKSFSQAEIDAYNASLVAPQETAFVPVEEAPAPEPVVAETVVFENITVTEEVPAEEEAPEVPDFQAMTKSQIADWAQENLDLELDARDRKDTMIETIEANI